VGLERFGEFKFNNIGDSNPPHSGLKRSDQKIRFLPPGDIISCKIHGGRNDIVAGFLQDFLSLLTLSNHNSTNATKSFFTALCAM
jgi:hypothetical protein